MLRFVTNYQKSPPVVHARSQRRSNTPSLPVDVQDHLGRMLRAEYHERGDRPRYLGDPAIPLAFDPYLQKLEQSERAVRTLRIREQGTKAVADALWGRNA